MDYLLLGLKQRFQFLNSKKNLAVLLLNYKTQQKHGNVSFTITVRLPDGSGHNLHYYPTGKEKTNLKYIRAKRKEAKKGKGNPYLTG